MFGGLLEGTGGDDGVGVGGGGCDVGGEERAADCEVYGSGLFGEGRGEKEVNFRAGGEGGVEVGCEGGFEGGFGGEVFSNTTGEAVMAAEAEGAAATRELVEAVEVKGEEGMRLVDVF